MLKQTLSLLNVGLLNITLAIWSLISLFGIDPLKNQIFTNEKIILPLTPPLDISPLLLLTESATGQQSSRPGGILTSLEVIAVTLVQNYWNSVKNFRINTTVFYVPFTRICSNFKHNAHKHLTTPPHTLTASLTRRNLVYLSSILCLHNFQNCPLDVPAIACHCRETWRNSIGN